jgi:hypothetical protein
MVPDRLGAGPAPDRLSTSPSLKRKIVFFNQHALSKTERTTTTNRRMQHKSGTHITHDHVPRSCKANRAHSKQKSTNM